MKRVLIALLLLFAVCTAQAEPVLLDFTASWCGPCQQMKSVGERLQAEGVKVQVVDIDRSPQLAAKHRVRGIPCYVVVDGDRELARHVGATSYEQLRRLYPSAVKQQAAPQRAWRYERVEGKYRSVVRVIAQAGPQRSLGSGCAVRWGTRLVIVTARHVIDGTKKVFVRGKTQVWECRVLGGDTDWDVVLLEPLNQAAYSDFDLTEIAWGNEGTIKKGQRLETCGFGSDDRLAVNGGLVVGFVRCGKAEDKKPDWVQVSGRARQGDSGGPVLNDKGEIVGVLWGTNGEVVVATQCGRLHAIMKYVLGPCPPQQFLKQSYAQISYVVYERPVVPVQAAPAGSNIQVGLFRNGSPGGIFGGGGCGPGGCGPQQPQQPPMPSLPEPPPQQPNIVVQADPRVGDSLERIDGKLDTVVQNTTPVVEDAEEAKDVPPYVVAAIVAAGVVLGFVVYFAAQKGN